ncbi:MAG: RloB family protein [Planctomycetia bacterium]|nr:RloB family protein [Planctomycetia bacterium]
MNLRCKKSRPLTRQESTYRDDRLFIIATEDTHAAKQYFDIFQNPRIKVRILPTEGGLSAPEYVLQRLDDFMREYQTMEEDEFWLMLDTDHWVEPNHIAGFNRVCIEATQKGFQLAHSNPCFEVWLLLHVTDLESSEQFRRCQDVVHRLKDTLGGYRKRSIDRDRFSPETAAVAVARAEKLDDSPGDRWPQRTGTRVYRVVKQMLPG